MKEEDETNSAEHRRVHAASGHGRSIEPTPRLGRCRLFTSLLARSDPAKNAGFWPTAEEDARRAIALTAVVAEYWWRLGISLDMQGRWIEAGTGFTRGIQLGPKSGPQLVLPRLSPQFAAGDACTSIGIGCDLLAP